MKDTKGYSKVLSNVTFFDGICSRRVKISEEENTKGVDYYRPAKTSHKVVCLSTLEKITKEWTGGYPIIMKSSPIVTGDITLMTSIYKYRSQKAIGFISKEGGGITETGVTYFYCYLDNYSNFSISPIFNTHIIGRYLNACNAIYKNILWVSLAFIEINIG